MDALEAANLKLKAVPVKDLRELARERQLNGRGTHGAIAARLLTQPPAVIDEFIKRKYAANAHARRTNLISDDDLLAELRRVESIDWGSVQGQLDGKIQREYVRVFTRYDDLLRGVRNRLHDEITGYAIASWYNHWSTVLIEDHISAHPNVVPTIKNIRGVDLFLRDYPFDLKITYLPQGYDLPDALARPTRLARWLYENQGQQRFGAENRFYVVLADPADVAQSWRLKREVGLIYPAIDAFLNQAAVTEEDILPFVFGGRSYTPRCKILLITPHLPAG